MVPGILWSRESGTPKPRLENLRPSREDREPMTLPPTNLDHERKFARDQARMLADHLEGPDVDFSFVAKHALALLQIAEFAWESPHAVVHIDGRA
jgi:hypothetical protein